MSFDDTFASVLPIVSSQASDGASKRRKAEEEGQREFLRVYETLPAQLLNAYGIAAYHSVDPAKIWEEFLLTIRHCNACIGCV